MIKNTKDECVFDKSSETLYSEWITKNYTNVVKKLKNVYRQNFNEDLLSDTLLYVTTVIKNNRIINNYEVYINLKYESLYKDLYNVSKARKKNGLTTDFEITTEDNETLSYIQDIASESDSLFDTNQSYNCIDDYNCIKRLDVIGYILKEYIDSDKINLFINILQSDFNFKGLDSIPAFKYTKIIREYRDDIENIKFNDASSSKVSNYKYLKDLVSKCWCLVIDNIDIIKSESNIHTYKNFDDCTLMDFIKE